ncbi:MAG: ParB N-terminal domain-containing protein [Rhodobacteraceae bacterium]|nr:ParB N-terminal domain-containing protein [Paracoccaceae bacterium]
MARKRLSGPKPEFLGEGTGRTAVAPEAKSMFGAPPIAQVAGESAAQNALRELVDDVARTRAEGRIVLKIPLGDIAPDHLARDRVNTDADELAALAQSIETHGQRTPIEVTALADIAGAAPKYGLISGWRRLLALEKLHDKTGDAQFSTVLALLRNPKDAASAYVSMVEENEVRVGLSYYERARVAAEATKRGVFETEKLALLSLFASASRAKRSRIRSFITLYHALDGVLQYPAAIPERLGLSLVEVLREYPEARGNFAKGLEQGQFASAADEMTALNGLIRLGKQAKPTQGSNVPRAEHLTEGLKIMLKGNKIVITGEKVSPDLLTRLKTMLAKE